MITNMPAFRLWFNTGKKLLECGAAWNNRAGTGFNVQLDSITGQRQLFLVPNLDKAGKPQGTAPFKVLYATGRVRSDGGQHTRMVGVAHVTADGQGYDLYVADPFGNLRLTLRPIVEAGTAANDDRVPEADPIPSYTVDVTADGTVYDAATGEVIEDPTPGERVAAARRTKRA